MQLENRLTAKPPKFSFFNLPNLSTQATFFATGGFAGLCTSPIEYTFQRTSSTKPVRPSSFLRGHLLTGLYRPAIRFWIFSIARSNLQLHFPAPPSTDATTTSGSSSLSSHLHTALIGGISGACGGLSEVFFQSFLVQRHGPTLSTLLNQSAKLFLCFGSYTFISTHFSDKLPPRPFWKCWSMGALAGGFGSVILAAAEGVRGRRALLFATGKGACLIGTVISVQVTSCRTVLDWIGEP